MICGLEALSFVEKVATKHTPSQTVMVCIGLSIFGKTTSSLKSFRINICRPILGTDTPLPKGIFMKNL